MELIKIIVGKLLFAGMWLIIKTNTIEVENLELLDNSKMVGYWHGDSVGVMLLLKILHKNSDITTNVVVSSNDRGDVLERMIVKIGAYPVRSADGVGVRHVIKDIMNRAKNKDRVFALTLDGPTGPHHEPKSMLFMLGRREKREVLVTTFNYSKVKRLNRWDEYAIPLLFGHIKIKLNPIDLTGMDDFETFAKSIPRE